MNKKIMTLITVGALSATIFIPTNNVSALEKNIQNDFEVVNEDGSIVNTEEITLKFNVEDVEIENAEKLIDAGLLSENYKEEILAQGKTKGTWSTTVWFEHPVTYTGTVNGYVNLGKPVFTAQAKATMTANLSQKLKVEINLSSIQNLNGYKTTKGSVTQGSYVGIGSTSTATQAVNVVNSSNLPVLGVVQPQYKAKNNSYVPGNAQVGFGLGTTLSWNF